MGKFIVIYGNNNLGKSEQINRLRSKLQERLGQDKVESIKYPIYSLEPTGPILNSVLREGFPMSNLDLQKTFAQNRRDFEPYLLEILKTKTVVAEDYKGTGIAWGAAHGIDIKILEEINFGLKKEDIAILLDGERFTSGIERGHRHESGPNWEKSRRVHLELASRYGWEVVNANQLENAVAEDIWDIICPWIK